MKKQGLYLSFIAALLTNCGHQAPIKPPLKHYTVHYTTQHRTLHFSGVIQPLHETVLITPFNATVKTINVSYGQAVKAGDLLFVLNSSELQQQFNETLMDYLKEKDNYDIARTKFIGTKTLWKEGLIAKNNYLSEKSSFMGAQLSILQSEIKLNAIMKKNHESKADFVDLNFSQFSKIRAILKSKHDHLMLHAPVAGILLFPPKSTTEVASPMTPGSRVKEGQVLGVIGDLSGVHVEIEIPEVDIHDIKPPMTVLFNGPSFKQPIKGNLTRVSPQASNNGNGNLPWFTATAEIPSLTEQQKQWLKVGMQAEIDLTLEAFNQLLIPLRAIQSKQGQSYVNVQPTRGGTTTRQIITGRVEQNHVAVQGLNPGEIILYE